MVAATVETDEQWALLGTVFTVLRQTAGGGTSGTT